MNDFSLPKADTEKSKAILLAAEKLFSENGYHNTSVEEIAKTADVSKGLVLYHFNSKTNLLQHLLINNIQTVAKQVEAIIQTNVRTLNMVTAD
jgi:AcrR family transcriptional regulator